MPNPNRKPAPAPRSIATSGRTAEAAEPMKLPNAAQRTAAALSCAPIDRQPRRRAMNIAATGTMTGAKRMIHSTL